MFFFCFSLFIWWVRLTVFLINFIHFTTRLQVLLPPLLQFLLPPSLHASTFLYFCSERARPPRNVNRDWHIKLRKDKSPPLVLWFGKSTQCKEYVLKSLGKHQGQALLILLEVLQVEQGRKQAHIEGLGQSHMNSVAFVQGLWASMSTRFK